MPTNPLPLDAAARDELARAAQSLLDAQDADAAVIVTADDNHEAAHDAYLAVCEAQDTFSRLATPDVILALLAAVERGEAETRDAEPLMGREDVRRAFASFAYRVALDSAGAGLDKAMAAAKEIFEVVAEPHLTDRGSDALHLANAILRAARAHPPIQETDNAKS